MINLPRVGSQPKNRMADLAAIVKIVIILKSRKRNLKHNPIDVINESIIWQIKPFVVAATSVRNKHWTFYHNLSVFGQIERLLNGSNCFEEDVC